jgi:two-component system, NarL family, sensor kinase
MKNILFLLLAFASKAFVIHAQVYEGFPEVRSYKSRLVKVDDYLQTDPLKCDAELDVLEKLAKKNSNKVLLGLTTLYRGIADYYIGQHDSALVYLNETIKIANEIGNKKLRSSASIRKLFILDASADPSILLRMMKDEYEDAKKRKDTVNMIYSLNGMAAYNERLDSTKQSINNYMTALKIAEQSKNDYEYAFLLNNIGLLKLRLKSPDQAFSDLQKGLKIAKRLESSRLEITIRENIGYCYSEMDSLDKAENEYRYTLELSRKKNYRVLAFHSLVNLGVVERSKGNIARSDSLTRSALKMAKDVKISYAISQIYLSLAQISLGKKDFKEVSSFLDSAAAYKKYGNPNEIQEYIYLVTYQSLQDQGKFEDALNTYKRLTTFRDSLDMKGHIQLMSELQLKYDVERSEREKLEERTAYEKKLTAEKLENATFRFRIGIVTVIFLVLLGLFLIHHYRTKQKKEIEFSNALVNKLEEERGRIARDLHDGLGQSLVILKNKISRGKQTEIDMVEDIDSDFSNVIEEVRTISRSLVPPELRRLGLSKSLEKLFREVGTNTAIFTQLDLESFSEEAIVSTDQVRLYRIIQELLNNTVKHANASALKLEISSDETEIKLTYQDNGIGFDIEKALQKDNSMGIKGIEQRIRAMNGSIRYEKALKGIQIKITLKPRKK